MIPAQTLLDDDLHPLEFERGVLPERLGIWDLVSTACSAGSAAILGVLLGWLLIVLRFW